MSEFNLRLFRDNLGAKVSAPPLPALNRVLYVVSGNINVSGPRVGAMLGSNCAWFSSDSFSFGAAAEGASLLRYELCAQQQAVSLLSGDGLSSDLVFEAKLDLQPGEDYLMRCDRVDLPPAGVAYTHTHQGPGIRCLLHGGFTVRSGDEEIQIEPGQAWFEAGPEPVLAWAPSDRPGHFSRVMILPRSLKGQSSIRYVNAEDAEKPKLQRYTVYIDEFISI